MCCLELNGESQELDVLSLFFKPQKTAFHAWARCLFSQIIIATLVHKYKFAGIISYKQIV